ncbi:Bifunctional solanapyrone synthase [Daldinia childiae]|uniref:Bifunctional solanapyrone synthase n=1 Tax=Daldinia childiae TaxID=326645 RepID=UPI001446E9CB|nr:Bifunctional solanapyrone synthase [Daldinia childiae]KAF3057407.1 Bifunctional solanapyrone synthase [Daldinia childiae]
MSDISQSAIANLEKAGLGDILYKPEQKPYEERIASYWSLTAQLKPWAIIQPRTTKEVSKTLETLVNTTDCNFAIRSGGHMAWAGSNNIEAGITIDLGLMTTTTYNPETKIASIQPGSRWADVYTELEKHGVMVAGGREGLVGVGGLLTGGGKTFYTCRYGFACDQVINYEVVLADGSVVEANRETNPDLFLVLKGGSNNFGIVTRFDMTTFNARNIWDGNITFPKSATDTLVEAFVDFTKNLALNPDDHILAMWTILSQTKDHFITMVLTNLDGVENSKSLQKFLTAPGGQGNMTTTTVAKKLVDFLVPSGKHDTWFTLTFKLDARIIKKAAEVFESLASELKRQIPDGNFYISMVLQPLPTSFSRHSVARGGNMFGIERLQDDCVLLVAAVEVETPEISSQVGFPALKAAIAEIKSYARSLNSDIEFLYLNYCDGSQNPFSTYGKENIKKMKEAAAKYDPTGVFQTRVPGGFKISKV